MVITMCLFLSDFRLCFILKRLQAVTPYRFRLSVIFSSVSCLSNLSRIIPLQLLRVLCSVTVTYKLKNFVIFKRFSE